jgi:hypothetical protein
VWLHTFLTSGLDRSDWSISSSRRFTVGEVPRYPSNKRLGGPHRQSVVFAGTGTPGYPVLGHLPLTSAADTKQLIHCVYIEMCNIDDQNLSVTQVPVVTFHSLKAYTGSRGVAPGTSRFTPGIYHGSH